MKTEIIRPDDDDVEQTKELIEDIRTAQDSGVSSPTLDNELTGLEERLNDQSSEDED